MGRRNIQMRVLYVSDNYKQVLTAGRQSFSVS